MYFYLSMQIILFEETLNNNTYNKFELTYQNICILMHYIRLYKITKGFS